MSKIIACIATLDTKGHEIKYIKDIIEKKGLSTLIIDAGVLGKPSFPPDITRGEVAKAAGTTIQDIIALDSGTKARAIMTDGTAKVVRELYSAGKLDGIISIGGGGGTAIGSTAMRELPIGVPKLMVSTTVAHTGGKQDMGFKDVTMMPSVSDIAGLNVLT
ncbi:Tm-1-like ATP-binding domain-containing protein, partial [Chloroflexota bacterium]